MLNLREIQEKTKKLKVGQRITIGSREGIIEYIHPKANFVCVKFKKYRECFFPEKIISKVS